MTKHLAIPAPHASPFRCQATTTRGVWAYERLHVVAFVTVGGTDLTQRIAVAQTTGQTLERLLHHVAFAAAHERTRRPIHRRMAHRTHLSTADEEACERSARGVFTPGVPIAEGFVQRACALHVIQQLVQRTFIHHRHHLLVTRGACNTTRTFHTQSQTHISRNSANADDGHVREQRHQQ